MYLNEQTVMGKSEPQKPELEKIELEIELPEGGISIGDLYSQKERYNTKTVIVRGKVMKVNQAIMKRNWIHIQDGSGDENSFDLTVTTDELPSVGDIVTLKGVVAVDKDFGSGYHYALIVEEGEQIDN